MPWLFPIMKLLIGLGNPGKKYERTRHNAGFLVIDALADELNISWKEKKTLYASIAEGLFNEKRLMLVKPQTFMNLSGKTLALIMKKFPVKPEDIVVVYDDADLVFGDVRFKQNGSSAGHKGMESILQVFPANSALARVRMGIGRSNTSQPLDEYVLETWNAQETRDLPLMIAKAKDLIRNFLAL